MRYFILTALFGLAFLANHASADVVLNEMRIDQPGADNDEFVELYSATGMSLDGITFIILQDNGSIDGAVDLSGFSINSGDVFLIGENDPLPTSGATPDFIATLNLENGENSSYMLVDGFTGSQGDDLDADDDGVFDAALPWNSILDGISLLDDEDTILDGGTEDIDYSAALGLGTLGPDGPFYPGYVYASVDGGGLDSIGAFDPAAEDANDTPGQLNAVPEPTSATLIGLLGMAALACRRRS